MELIALNTKHHQIIERLTNNVEGFIYRVTDATSSKAYENFKPVMINARLLHNDIGDELKELNITESEWVFMLPNFWLFASLGFAAAIETQHNTETITTEREDLLRSTTKIIAELESMVDDYHSENKLKQTK